MSSEPRVHVAIVNWNTAQWAVAAARAFRASESVRARVTVFDNGSEPSDRELLRDSLGPEFELILSERNLGYGRAANSVLSVSEWPMLCVSNADVLPAPAMLSRLAAVALSDPSAGLVAPCLQGTGEQYHARLPRALSLPFRAFVGSIGHRTVPNPAPGTVVEVEQPAGACLLMRRELWQLLGGFDPGFFLWFEDVDLARRARLLGARNLVVGDAVARHQGAAAFRVMSPASRQSVRLDSLQRYAVKHHPAVAGPTRVAVRAARRLRARP